MQENQIWRIINRLIAALSSENLQLIKVVREINGKDSIPVSTIFRPLHGEGWGFTVQDLCKAKALNPAVAGSSESA